jgi:hypothetical protein
MSEQRLTVMAKESPPQKCAGSARFWAMLLRRICILIVGEIEREFEIEPKR